MENNSLKYVNASYSNLITIVYPFYCPWNVIPQIENLDFRNNNLQCINASVFNKTISGCNWRSLKYLYLGSNKLDNIDKNACNDDKNNAFGFLEPLINLRVIDLSSNQIIYDDKLTSLQTFTNLEELNLFSNAIHNFSLNLNNMTKIVRLNLAKTIIWHVSHSPQYFRWTDIRMPHTEWRQTCQETYFLVNVIVTISSNGWLLQIQNS